ncbi:MAG: BamA/TamA family outer membrane protein, partial [Methylocystis sp.]|nr:BamA/TamA family outer membrane protein [Methylocystis sp.]
GRTNFSTNLPTIPGLTCIPAFTAAANFGHGSCVVPASNDFRIRSSVGASLLWQSPMGPIRFDYAVVTSKSQADITQNFRFTGGTNF